MWLLQDKLAVPADIWAELLANASSNNTLALTSGCNLACVFCSHRQNPPALQRYRMPPLPFERVMEAAAFLSPGRKVIIGESATRFEEGEPFTHPEILEILRALRRLLPATPFAITTNATLLSSSVLAELAALQPLELTVSLNSCTFKGRRLLLNDREPKRALQAVAAFASYGLSFHGSVVAMPHLVGAADLKASLRFLAEQGAVTSRLFLPGYTKFAPPELRFPVTLWDELKAVCKELTFELGMPVLPEPSLPEDLTPEIYGIIGGTPAKKAGLLAGDVLLAVDGKQARSRVEAFKLVREAADPLLAVRRAGEDLAVRLDKEQKQSSGMVMHFDLEPQRFSEAEAKIRRARSQAPLILTSRFAEKLVELAVAAFGLPEVTVKAAENSFFGGSIMAAGLLVVADLLAAAEEAMSKRRYDLVLVPQEVFDRRDFDLVGVNLAVLQERLRVPVLTV